MGYHIDVINGALKELSPDLIDAFTKKHAALTKVFATLDMEKAKGPYADFNVVYGGVGTNNRGGSGGRIVGGRRKSTTKGRLHIPRMIRAYDVPRGDIDQSNTPGDVVGILNQYPVSDMAELRESFVRQWLMGDMVSEDLDMFFTLNGNQTYNTGMGAENGLFPWITPAAQVTAARVTHAISAATVPNEGWTTQLGEISAFETDGRSVMRDTYYKCNSKGKMFGNVDSILTDPTTYLNFEDSHIAHVRVGSVTGDGVSTDPELEGLEFIPGSGCRIYREEAMDITSAALPAHVQNQGFGYMINSKTFCGRYFDNEGTSSTKDDDGIRVGVTPLFRHPTEDAYRGEFVLTFQTACKSLRNNGHFFGGAR